MAGSVTADLYDVLNDRGLVAQCTDESIHERLAQPVSGYIGFDPTADSLHVGSLVPIMGLAWMQRCGHKPLVLVGGATALVGDPSGKSSMRQMLGRADVAANGEAIRAQIARIVRFGEGPSDALLVNNADWLAECTWIELLREVGPHFSVNRMLGMDSVKSRLESGGISFLEFNYMVMQAYDFLHLYRSHGCSLQMGGQDQWGNIVMGIELTRRVAEASVAGVTMPLVTRADGGKFGKSEAGNIWLSAERTPVYEFYQFWRNVADADVGRFLGYFTFMEQAELERLAGLSGQAVNEAKEILALEVTTLVHGRDAAQQAQRDAQKAFGAAHDVSGDSIPHGPLAASELEEGRGLLELLVRAGLASSKSEAKRLVQGGGVRIGEAKVDDIARVVTTTDTDAGSLLLRAGKKRLYRFDLV